MLGGCLQCLGPGKQHFYPGAWINGSIQRALLKSDFSVKKGEKYKIISKHEKGAW